MSYKFSTPTFAPADPQCGRLRFWIMSFKSTKTVFICACLTDPQWGRHCLCPQVQEAAQRVCDHVRRWRSQPGACACVTVGLCLPQAIWKRRPTNSYWLKPIHQMQAHNAMLPKNCCFAPPTSSYPVHLTAFHLYCVFTQCMSISVPHRSQSCGQLLSAVPSHRFTRPI